MARRERTRLGWLLSRLCRRISQRPWLAPRQPTTVAWAPSFERLEDRTLMSATLGMDVNYVKPAESTIDLAGMLDPSAVAEVAAPLSFASSNVSESHVDLSQFFRDENGNVLEHDQSLVATLAPKSNAKPVAAATPYPLGNTFGLHSNPGASKVIYLDFDGHTTTGTYWTVDTGASSRRLLVSREAPASRMPSWNESSISGSG